MTGPTKEDLDPVLRAFGSACFQAQNLEGAFRMLLVLKAAQKNQKYDIETIRDVESATAASTLRSLFQAAKQAEYFTPAEERMLNKAIKERNFVIHGYFDKYATLLAKVEGRQWLVKNLHEIRDLLHSANYVVVSLCDRYLTEQGMGMEALKSYADTLWESGTMPPEELFH